MKVVLDTNVWLSAIFWKGEANKIVETIVNQKNFSLTGKFLGCSKEPPAKTRGFQTFKHKKISIIITENILSEIIEVLNKEEKFQKFIEDRKQKIEDLIRTILSFSALIKTKSKFELIKEHPKDNIILEAAFDGKADYIVSYDKHILNMIEFRNIKILKPDNFLKMIK